LAFGISGHKWLRLFVLALALYIGILPLWWYSLSAISAGAGTCASWIYSFFDARVAISPRGRVVQLVVNGKLQSSGLRIDMVTYGLPMLMAFLIVTRSNSLVAKLRAIAIGCAVMFGLTVCAVMAWAKMTSLQLEQQAAPGSDQSSFFFLAFHGYTFSQPALAVMIWLALIVLGLFNWRSRHETVARNASCPCGSGRKYKRCCGT
jgi:SEC-C motif-containing protein